MQEEELLNKQLLFSESIRRINRQEVFQKKRGFERKEVQCLRQLTYVVDGRYQESIEEYGLPYIYSYLRRHYDCNDLPLLNKYIHSSDILENHLGVIGIRKILSAFVDPPVQLVIDCGLVPKFISYIKQSDYPQLQLEATWALTNIASGSKKQCQCIVEKGCIPLFLDLLNSQHMGIVEQSFWALGNTSCDSNQNRNAIIQLGGIERLAYAIEHSTTQDNIQNGLWCLSNVCRGNPVPNFHDIRPALQLLAKYIVDRQFKDKQTLSDCLWSIEFSIKESSNEVSEILLDAKFDVKLPELLKDQEHKTIIPTIRILGLMARKRENICFLLSDRLVQALSKLLKREKKVIVAETCWAISSLATGFVSELHYLLNQETLITQLVQLFQTETNQIKVQIASFFENLAMEGDPELVHELFSSINIIQLILINLMNDDPKLISACLEILYSVLSMGCASKVEGKNRFVLEFKKQNGEEVLQGLQFNKQSSIYDLVVKILTQFFEFEEYWSI